MKRKIGLTLLVFAYVILLYTAVTAPLYARAHANLDPAFLAAYAAPWPVALTCLIALTGVVLALIPIRRGDRWASWTSAAIFLTLFATRMSSDPRCLVVLDPHQHGCHTFMISVILGLSGLGFTSLGPSRATES